MTLYQGVGPISSDSVKPNISVSFHPNKSVVVKTFRPRVVKDLNQLKAYVENYVCSPIIYRGDKRAKENFLSAGWIGLDIDEGFALEEAISMLKDFQATAIVGVTKSHQKWKEKKPPCDRFRILIEMATPCEDCELFEYNVKAWRKVFSGDRATTDGARLFLPCKIVFSQEAYPQDWLPFPKGYHRESDVRMIRADEIQFHKKNKTLPAWITRVQKHGTEVGGRHKMCYVVGATLTEFGYSVNEITDFLCLGPLVEIGVKDVRRQVEWGAAAAVRHAAVEKFRGGVQKEDAKGEDRQTK